MNNGANYSVHAIAFVFVGCCLAISLVPRGDLGLDGDVAGDAHADVGADVGGVADVPRAALVGDGRG